MATHASATQERTRTSSERYQGFGTLHDQPAQNKWINCPRRIVETGKIWRIRFRNDGSNKPIQGLDAGVAAAAASPEIEEQLKYLEANLGSAAAAAAESIARHVC